jgi:hypothetical protein
LVRNIEGGGSHGVESEPEHKRQLRPEILDLIALTAVELDFKVMRRPWLRGQYPAFEDTACASGA